MYGGFVIYRYLIFIFLLFSSIELYAEDNIVSFSEEIFYNGSSLETAEEINRLIDRNINFTAQTSFTLDAPDSEDSVILDRIENILTNVKNFEHIPYYSKRHDKTYKLFKNITVLKDETNKSGARIIVADQTIPPFKPADIRYTIEKKANCILFKAENIENIRWWFLPVITQKKMLVIFSAEIIDDRIECYGLGTADTGSFFFMRKRLKDAFNGRTESLIRWIHKMLNEKL